MRPRKHLERKVDGCRIEGIHGVVQIDAESLAHVQTPCFDDQGVGEITIDAPVTLLVRIGQGAAGDVSADAEVIEFALLGAQTHFDVAQAFTERQLRECHAEILVEVREGFGRVARWITCHAAAERVEGEEVHKLGEDQFADGHGGIPGLKNPSFPKSLRNR